MTDRREEENIREEIRRSQAAPRRGSGLKRVLMVLLVLIAVLAAVVAAAAVCPIVNTGVLYLVLVLFFDTSWAAVLSAFMSVNFLLELAVNIVLAPAVLRIVTMRRRAA